ncbi:hypothetical protein Q4910_001596 [Campylobacter jejuni]|nr:hypothetical protein [Campylobacter jejuni]
MTLICKAVLYIQIEEKTINKDSAKIRVLVLFNNDNNQSSNVFLAKKDRK